jgi:hypothetical protein
LRHRILLHLFVCSVFFSSKINSVKHLKPCLV